MGGELGVLICFVQCFGKVEALELDASPCGAYAPLPTAIDKQLQFPSLCPI